MRFNIKDLNFGSKRIEGKKWYTVAFNSVIIPAEHSIDEDGLEWDFDEVRETHLTCLAESREAALERARKIYPNSETGYTIIEEGDAFEPTEEEKEERDREIADYYG